MTGRLEADDVPTEAQLLERARDAWMNEVHTSFPARVERIEDGADVVDVLKPMVRRSVASLEGPRVVETLPLLRAVRIEWPGGGDWFLKWPLAAGATGVCEIAERDFTRWARTGEDGPPVDIRNHHLTFAIFRPGLRSSADPIGSIPSGAMVLGKRGVGAARIALKDNGDIDVGSAALQLVALANLVRAELDKIQATLASGTVANETGPGATPVVFAVPYTASDVAASKTRAA